MTKLARRRLPVAAATGNQAGANARRSSLGQPFSWSGKEGWEDHPYKRATHWHFWRHRHSVCGAYEWPHTAREPRLLKEPLGDRCKKCEGRRTRHRRRRLSRDHEREV